MTAQRLTSLLQQLEDTLRLLGLWQSAAPSALAMQSTVPFCYDTMPLTSWLQFVFLPKMQALLASGSALPANLSIVPLAEMLYADQLPAYQPLLSVLHELEQCLNQV